MRLPDESPGRNGPAQPARTYAPGEKILERLRYFLQQRELPPEEAGAIEPEAPIIRAAARARARREAAAAPNALAAAPPGLESIAEPGEGDGYDRSPYLSAAKYRAEDASKAAALPAVPGVGSAAAPPAPPPSPAWRPLGPLLIPRGQTYGSGPGSRPSVSGRVAAIAVDPSRPQHVLVASAGGGIWETRDAGASWAPRTDQAATGAMGAIVFDPGNPLVAYAGTGEGNFYSRLGTGILRSTDGGTTWAPLAGAPFVGTGFYDLVVDPGNTQHLFAATTAVLADSADGGTTWRVRRSARTWAISLGQGEVLAACSDGLQRSTNGGATWAPVPLPGAAASFRRLAVCHAKSSPGVAYAFGVDANNAPFLWRRSTAGGAFAAQPLPPGLQIQQAWYDWFAAVKPNDPNTVFLGAIDVHRGVRGSGGAWTWTNISTRQVTGDSIHPDQHAIAFEAGNANRLYVGNDGGVYFSADAGNTWTSRNPGLGITEFEYLAQHPLNATWVMGGTQDNGTLRRSAAGTTWDQVAMGDGGDCGVDDGTPSTCYHTYYGMGIERSVNSGTSWSAIGPPVPSGYGALFYPPLSVNGATLSQAGQSVWITLNQGGAWTNVPVPGGALISALEVVSATVVLAASLQGNIYRLTRVGAAWSATALASPRFGYISDIFVNPAAPGTIWVTYSDIGLSPHVFVSTNGGGTWHAVVTGLPSLPANAVVVDPVNAMRVFVALDVQVYQSLNQGATWALYGTGLPNALAADLLIHAPSRTLRVGTRNRGAWEISI